jgi:carbon-monoxide dehydrogenase medium subunit
VALAAPLLVEALGYVAHPPIRNSGTVGGSLAHADPSAELPAVALALDAELLTAGPSGTRTIPAAEFFRGPFTTALEPGEILTEVRIPRREGVGGYAFVEFARTHGNFALVGEGHCHRSVHHAERGGVDTRASSRSRACARRDFRGRRDD